MTIVRGYFGKLYFLPGCGFVHHCQGCNEAHVIPFDRPEGGPTWEFNFDQHKPHFTPSLRHSKGRRNGKDREQICHYNIEHGEIYFHGDSTHLAAGERLPLEELNPDEKRFWENIER
jgi:hypothetical protein